MATRYFFRDVMGVVEPKQRVLGITHVQKRIGVGRTVRKQDEVIEIPLKSLEQMLQDPAILDQVLHSHQIQDGLLSDYCDGNEFKSHPLFSIDPTALQIILYYDEVEIVNPLGSKTGKHKLGLVYYTLGNILP
ncbi:uncharacterized protein LOC124457571 [Xenia sp. Carnegie-2017]|uniref:uncharacterized protein LOC124457571 n=1 Tax=Xenia sp. Carnegie-2017 TaxID=2897299 RepID=UPI001F040F5D|nr:uncharacterized protein LOC124457571 [Xenia sp. Carnegie-2017]